MRRISRTPAPARSYDEEEDRPRRRRRDDDEEEQEERRRPRRPIGRRSRSDDDDEDRPRRPRARSRDDDDEQEDDEVGGVGWGGYKRVKDSMPSDFPNQFEVTEELSLIKFLEPGPFYTYKQHWADWMPRGSKLSYVCPGEGKCPICDDVGDNPQFKSAFNVLDFSDPEVPTNKVLIVGMTVGTIIENFHKDEKTGPIDRFDRYFTINKSKPAGSKSKGRTQTNLHPIKSRDVEEDYGVVPLEKDDLEDYEKKMWDRKAIPVTPPATLREVAEAALED